MKDRIRKILESQHMTQQEFAETIKVAPATLSSIFTGRTAPSLKIVESIKSRFPDISTDWLMFGRGAMTDYRSTEAGESFDSPSTLEGRTVVDFGVASGVAGEDGGARQAKLDGAASEQKSAHQSSVESRRAAAGQQSKSDTAIFDKGMQLVKNSDTNDRSIVEIRIFYSDQTWETFVPKK